MKFCYKHHCQEFDKLPNFRRGEASTWETVSEDECPLCNPPKEYANLEMCWCGTLIPAGEECDHLGF